MIVKAYRGDGQWKLWSATDVEFLGRGNCISVTDGDHVYSEDDRFPMPWEYMHRMCTRPPLRDPATADNPDPEGFRLERWVRWTDPADGEIHLLCSDGEIYILNDNGKTIEALH